MEFSRSDYLEKLVKHSGNHMIKTAKINSMGYAEGKGFCKTPTPVY